MHVAEMYVCINYASFAISKTSSRNRHGCRFLLALGMVVADSRKVYQFTRAE